MSATSSEQKADFCFLLSVFKQQTWRGRGKLSENWGWIGYWLVSKRIGWWIEDRKCGVVRDFAESTGNAALCMDWDWENLCWEHRAAQADIFAV